MALLETVKRDWYAFDAIAKKKPIEITDEIILEAITGGNYKALGFVQEDKLTAELCLKAAKIDGRSIAVLTEDLR